MLVGLISESRAWREQTDEYWATELNIPGLTPRKVMQLIGTDIMRAHFDNDIWIKSLKKKIIGLLSKGANIIITDCRFSNEARAIKNLGGKVLLVDRKSSIPK